MAPSVLDTAQNPTTPPATLAKIVQTSRLEEARRAALQNPNLDLVEVALPLLVVRQDDTYGSKKALWSAILANPQWEFLVLTDPGLLDRVSSSLWDYWSLWFATVWRELTPGTEVSANASEVLAHALFDIKHPPEWYRTILALYANDVSPGDATRRTLALDFVQTLVRTTFNSMKDRQGTEWLLRLYLALFYATPAPDGSFRYLIRERGFRDPGMEALAALLGIDNPDLEPHRFVRQFRYTSDEEERNRTMAAIRQQAKKLRAKEVDRWFRHIAAAHIIHHDDKPDLFGAFHSKRGSSPSYKEQYEATVGEVRNHLKQAHDTLRFAKLRGDPDLVHYEGEVARLEAYLARFEAYAP